MELQEKSSQKSEIQFEPNDEKTTPSIIDRLRDPVIRRKLLRWICVPVGFFSIGIADSLAGTTNIDTQILTSTNGDVAGYYLTAMSLGYLLGNILAGVLYGKVNSHFLAVSTTALGGIVCIGTPYCTTFATMFIMRCAIGFFLGILLCILNTEHMQIWGNEGASLLQLVNALYAMGGVVGPLMTAPFISEKEIVNKTLSDPNSTLYLWNNVTEQVNSTLDSWSTVTEPTQKPRRTTNVHYAFLIAGIILIVSTIPALLALVLRSTPEDDDAKETTLPENVERKLPFRLRIFMIVSLFSYCLSYCCVEMVFISFLVTFLEKQYETVTAQDATYTTTFFWASFAACRFVSIFTSRYLTSIRQLYMHYSLMVFAFSGFLISAIYSRIDILTAFTCIAGVACSAIFAAMISWTEAELMKVTGPISAVILVGSSTGVSIVPIVVGYLMVHVSNLWFCYCLMLTIAIALAHFIFILCFNRYYVDRKYGKLYEPRVIDKQDVSQIHPTDEIHPTNKIHLTDEIHPTDEIKKPDIS